MLKELFLPETALNGRWRVNSAIAFAFRRLTVRPLYLIELNEVNFDFVRRYVRMGRLPCFSKLLQRHGLGSTTSESAYEQVEPWIQWVTAHTGKTYAEHGVFRLGDIVGRDLDQVWEVLERRGITVGAVSPMNAENRLRAPAFFVPDPWTSTPVSADRATRMLYGAVVQAVAENAQGRLAMRSLIGLLAGFARNVSAGRWRVYVELARRLRGRPWIKATILDRLLADVFLSQVRRARPRFASLFLNAAAHIQHHYMFNSVVYDGERQNPEWYVRQSEDPVFEIYSIYDRIVADIQAIEPDTRVIIATGLHQDPYPDATFYWRLKEHVAFLTSAGVQFESVEPLMSRDFLVRFRSTREAELAKVVLEAARIEGEDARVFEVDNRGDSLFCTLVFGREIKAGMVFTVNGRRFAGYDAVAFVAIKNGHHNPLGYLIDTDAPTAHIGLPLSEIYRLVTDHFDADRVAA